MIDLKNKTGVVFCLVGVTALSFLACGKKKEAERQKSLDMVTIRTVGLAYLEENKLAEAEKEFLKLIEIAPKEALGYANLGLVYMRMAKYPEAESQFKKALEIEPDDADIRLNLAEIYEQTHREDEAVSMLEGTLKSNPDHVKSLYKLAQFYSKSDDEQLRLRGEGYLRKVVEKLPANIAARIQFVQTLLHNGKTDQAAAQMEALRQQMPELPKESVEYFEKGLALMLQAKADEATVPTMIFHNFLRVTPIYQRGILELKGAGGPLMGSPILTFSQDISLQMEQQGAILETMHFTDATAGAGLDSVQSVAHGKASNAVVAAADYDNDGDQDLYVSTYLPDKKESVQFLFRNDFGRFVDIAKQAGIRHPGQDEAAIFADYDNDGYLDLFIVNSSANVLYHNVEKDKFQDVAAPAGVARAQPSQAAVFADFDHEGDLDLYLLNAAQNQLYRNNSDGTFTEQTEKMGLAGGGAKSRDAAFGDFDEDGDLDLFVANENASNLLFTNLRQGRFEDITEKSGLRTAGGSGAVTVGDYNNDGFLDLFVTALKGGRYHLYRNKSDGTFAEDRRSKAMFRALRNVAGLDAQFLDFDNDGFLDLLVAGEPISASAEGSGLRLFHNDGAGRFEDVSSLLPQSPNSGRSVAVADYNEDGDLDLFVAGFDGAVRLLRNDGGNANKYLKVKLLGLRSGSGKNNHFGIGAKLEVRAGDLYQIRIVDKPMSHFGLGRRLKADVVRILWPNGVAQNLFYPGSNQDLVEEQSLKGSCAFVYSWNGREYEFVTDVMWRSALGMPLGIMGGATAYAFPNSSQDYFRIPGERLQAQKGVYSLQITEELWETAFFDKLELVAIDHPDSLDLFIDERFVPPPVPPLEIFEVRKRQLPKSVTDGEGNDLLPQLRAEDDVYVANLVPAKYQGVTQMHDLVLDLGDQSRAKKITLFLNGWIFPTDASINVALSQSDALKVTPPFLQVLDKKGKWQTVLGNLSFPMGKKKFVVADLTGKFLTSDFRVRIRTNMEIYWDYVFFATEDLHVPVHKSILRPASANIHYRGFSRLYRKGGRHGPHWFDYSDVSTEQKWRDLEGNYTRYGNVQPLLLESDDRFVIVNAGDEITVTFDANQAPPLPPGWSRDFLIYTDGWIKDGDLNTAHGKTVAPLPFHAMSRYPYGQDEAYPGDEEHQKFLETYNTRKVTTQKFRSRLSQP
ncbi:MAG: FG-GAP-like repeat-containing protein [bacterium]